MSSRHDSGQAAEMYPPLRLVFMGTPDFAAVILRRLAAWEHGHIAAVYCREDKPAGRGHKLTPPPVKVAAQELGLTVMQPRNFKEATDRDALAAFAPDVLVVAAYGLILPQAVLDIPTMGPYNVHASLLPRLRGAAPIQRAIINGDNATGITIMRMEAGLDTGPMLMQRALGIGIDDTTATLHDQLADLGARLMLESLEALHTGTAPAPIPQDDARATYAARMDKSDGFIDWHAPAAVVHARIRGVTPWPGARAEALLPDRAPLPLLLMPGHIGAPFQVTGPESGPKSDPALHPIPGTLLGLVDDHLAVACADAWYLIPEVRLSGKSTMTARAFWNGYGARATSGSTQTPQMSQMAQMPMLLRTPGSPQ